MIRRFASWVLREDLASLERALTRKVEDAYELGLQRGYLDGYGARLSPKHPVKEVAPHVFVSASRKALRVVPDQEANG